MIKIGRLEKFHFCPIFEQQVNSLFHLEFL